MSRPQERWALIVHGGATTIQAGERAAYQAGCLAALRAGRAVLQAGGNAVEAVTAAILVLEDDPTFNAGTGAAARTDGQPEFDAALMDGHTLNLGAVAALRGVRHPVQLARTVLDSGQVLLAGHGARHLAAQHGLLDDRGHAPRTALVATDTVGCVALDTCGHLAAGTSTGGTEGQPPGRVGDSPLAGCGFYADDELGAVAVSGDGEGVVRVGLARQVLEQGTEARKRVPEAIKRMSARVGGTAGVILLTPQGEVVWNHNSAQFAVAWQTASMPEAQVALEHPQRADGGKQRGEA